MPGRFGIGDLGPSAYEFADFLFAAGQKLWQVLPLNPTGYADSPYQCFSAFAGKPMLLSLESLRERGLLQESDLDQPPPFSGWWSSSGAGDSTRTPEDVRKEHDFARAYLNLCGEADINWIMIGAVLASVADVAICSAAEFSETGEHGAHESSRHAEWKLEMAVSSGSIER